MVNNDQYGSTTSPLTRAENPRVGSSILPLAIVNDIATTGGTEEGGAHARQCIRTVRRRRRADPAAGAGDHILGPWPGQAEGSGRVCGVPQADPRASPAVLRVAGRVIGDGRGGTADLGCRDAPARAGTGARYGGSARDRANREVSVRVRAAGGRVGTRVLTSRALARPRLHRRRSSWAGPLPRHLRSSVSAPGHCRVRPPSRRPAAPSALRVAARARKP